MSTPKLPIDLTPTPGFCIKSTVVNPATVSPPARPESRNVLEPAVAIVVPAGRKVFINICYDEKVPSPPPADEAAIKRATSMQEQDEDSYYVPVVVSHPREDKDKAGNPSLVIDCIYNTSMRSRALRGADFKLFLVELALQRIEAQIPSLTLSRNIGTPNITAKGKLEPRRVWVPTWLATGQRRSSTNGMDDHVPNEKPLIEVLGPSEEKGPKDESISTPGNKLKGILKNSGPNTTPTIRPRGVDAASESTRQTAQQTMREPQVPLWSWRKESNERLLIIVPVSKETPYGVISQATLDIEARRLILRVPGSSKSSALELDIDLSKSDAELVATMPGVSAAVLYGTDDDDKMKEPSRTLLLKRQRDFDVDGASAEWKIAEGQLLIYV